MTLLLPFLSLYVKQLCARTPAAVVQWSGIAFGATFLGAGLVAPLWGKLADLYGRKTIPDRRSIIAMLATAMLLMLANMKPRTLAAPIPH